MSKELNLHYSSLNYMASRQKKLDQVKEVMSKTGKSDLKQLNPAEMRKLIREYQSKVDDDQSQKTKKTVGRGVSQSPSTASGVRSVSVQSQQIKRALQRKKLGATRDTSMLTTQEDKRASQQHSLNISQQIYEQMDRRVQISRILKERRSEFIDLVESYLASKGAGDSGQLLAANDFKQILSAFGIKLTP